MIVIAYLVLSLEANERKGVDYADSYGLVHFIDKHAIIMGSGKKNVYVFIDPLCRYSRKFMKLSANNESLLKKYRFHLFLYEIPRLHSSKVINAIYSSKEPLQLLKEVMLKNKKIGSNKELDEVRQISKVATKIGVFKRPFIIVSQGEQ